ncbi:orexin/Hypocretin receptor type 1-like [Oppia nitens]|uniref:orexin/Hypocretin receptor type 1-like n=1 Tax=Oppia nitens TaxID=1686743 RepID=UPI0023DAC4BA|nr:orexin/Hypocretin receptor type 1-like [Oppia nitens]
MADIDMIDPNESAIKVMDSALDSNATINMTADDIREMLKQFLNHPDYLYDKWVRNLIIICFYCTIVIISLFGNLMVCYVIFKKRRMRTETNLLMANLTVSDIVMTAINIPFNVTRILMDDWLFGHTLCILLPLIQVTSV